MMRTALLLAALGAMAALSAGCSTDPQEGTFPCEADSDCPATWVCRADERCWRTPDGSDAGGDAGDAGSSDTGAADTSGMDVPMGMDAPEMVDGGGLDGGDETDAPIATDVPEGTDGGTPDDAPTMPDAGSDGGTDAGATDAGRDAGGDAGGPCGGLPMMTFYRDADGDGHGAAASGTMMRCGPGGGYVASNDDCDDGNGGRFPGNAELCNGVDDDCLGGIDGAAADAACASVLPNTSTAECIAPACAVQTCRPSFGNCDSVDMNGCESDFMTDEMHCGGCSSPCGAATDCIGGACDGDAVTGVYSGGSFFFDGGAGFCAVRSSGRVACWGAAVAALPGATSPAELVLPSGDVAAGPHALAIGDAGGCAAMADGSVNCWGSNTNGAYGDGSTTTSATPVRGFPAVGDATMVARPIGATCVLRASGRVMCAGNNEYGMLGNGSTTPSSTPVLVGLTGVSWIDASDYEVCAVASGSVHCWGANQSGVAMMTPTLITGIADAVSVTVSRGYSCALRAAGRITCWGVSGSLLTSSTGLTDISGFSATPVEIDAADRQFCARITGGFVECYGDAPGGGTAGPLLPPTAPARASGVSGAISIATNERGPGTVCAASTGGVVRCWGGNGIGQLGNGTRTASLLPGRVTGF